MDKKWIERHRERHRIVRFPLENYAGILGYEEKDSAFCKKWRESYYSIWALKKAQLDYYVCCWILFRLRCLLASKRKELCKQFGNPANGGSVKLLSFSLLRAHPLQLLWSTTRSRLSERVVPGYGNLYVYERCGFGRALETLQRRLPAQGSSGWWWAHGCTDSRWNLLRLLVYSRLLSTRFLSRFLCRDIDRRRSRSSRRSVRCPYYCL
jgi:hypothetical protein